jgi:hypothetical protein
MPECRCRTGGTNLDADVQLWYLLVSSIADPDPGSGAFMTPGSGIRIGFFRIPDPKPIFLLELSFLGKNFKNSLKFGPNFFSSSFQIQYNIQFC